jgi:ATP-dependent Clp protease ATP-binding subunit ClpA
MFERFTPSAREVLVLAQEEAGRLGHNYIGTEHLLLGLLLEDEGVGGRALTASGVTHEAVAQEVLRIVGAGLPAFDADALTAIGIDLDTVRQVIEESFGPGALERPPAPCRRRWGRRRCQHTAGGVRLTPRAKKVLEISLRQALALRHDYIGTEHLLLALLREGEGLAVQVLTGLGFDLAVLRAQVMARIGRVA